MKKYFPIVVSKLGELTALHKLDQNVKDGISPVIQVLNQTIIKREMVKVPGSRKKVFTGEYIYDKTLENTIYIHWLFHNNQIILDFSLFDNLESEINHVKRIMKNLLKVGINIVPAIQKNSPTKYENLIKELIREFDCKICIKTSNSSGGIINYNKHVNEMASKFDRTPEKAILLFDLGQIDKDNYNKEGGMVGLYFQTLSPSIKKWNNVVVASSSFPKDLTHFDVQDEPHLITRYEWKLFNELQQDETLKHVKYGDYGTKYAIFEEVDFSGSISLKYSTKNKFVIYRGEKTDNHDLGHGQYIVHAKNLTNSVHYTGEDFSWGDENYLKISKEDPEDDDRKTGNASQWVANSQNHHIKLIHSLL
jgi:hypothetical protein